MEIGGKTQNAKTALLDADDVESINYSTVPPAEDAYYRLRANKNIFDYNIFSLGRPQIILLSGMMVSLLCGTTNAFAPIAKDIEAATTVSSSLLTVFQSLGMVGLYFTIPAGWSNDHLGPFPTCLASALIAAGGYFLVSFATDPNWWMIGVGISLAGFGSGGIFIAVLATVIKSRPNHTGSGVALVGSMMSLSMAFTSLLITVYDKASGCEGPGCWTAHTRYLGVCCAAVMIPGCFSVRLHTEEEEECGDVLSVQNVDFEDVGVDDYNNNVPKSSAKVTIASGVLVGSDCGDFDEDGNEIVEQLGSLPSRVHIRMRESDEGSPRVSFRADDLSSEDEFAIPMRMHSGIGTLVDPNPECDISYVASRLSTDDEIDDEDDMTMTHASTVHSLMVSLRVFRHPYFWALFISYFAAIGAGVLIIANFKLWQHVAPGKDYGSALNIGFSVINCSGTLLAGWSSDFLMKHKDIPRAYVLSAFLLYGGLNMIGMSIIIMSSATVHSSTLQVILLALHINGGFTFGSSFSLFPSLCSEIWGPVNFGKYFSFLQIGSTSALVIPIVASSIQEKADNFYAIYLSLGCLLVVCAALAVIPKREYYPS